ncbi:MAG: hypothetical protein Fues2KO_33420 [Fuerstiella sp.]
MVLIKRIRSRASEDTGERYVYDASEFQAGIGGALVDPTRAFGWVDDIVLVFDESGTLVERLLHGPQVDQVLTSEDASGDVQWFLGDHLGTIRDVVEYDSGTDTTTVVNHLQYSSFGQITSQTSSANEPRYAFTGREWDADTDLYYYRARWYDPTAGRFVSDDPIGFAAGDVNVSRYVGNTATSSYDPSGLEDLVPTSFPVRPWYDPGDKSTLPKHEILTGVTIWREPQLMPLPPGMPRPGLSSGSGISPILEPGEIAGVSGCGPCTGLILVPPEPGMPTHIFHIGPEYDPTVMIPDKCAPGYIGVLCGAEIDPSDPEANESAMGGLAKTIEELKEINVPVNIYVPAAGVGVDFEGNLIWTIPSTYPTDSYENELTP